MSDERAALDAMLAIVREFALDALTVRVGETTYELTAHSDVAPSGRSAGAVVRGEPAAAPAAASSAPPPSIKRVVAPVIGVFYRASSPGIEPFVEVGARVEVGQPLCILEAMKLMNEITSDYAGVVLRILPENGALVSLGEEMFWIEP